MGGPRHRFRPDSESANGSRLDVRTQLRSGPPRTTPRDTPSRARPRARPQLVWPRRVARRCIRVQHHLPWERHPACARARAAALRPPGDYTRTRRLLSSPVPHPPPSSPLTFVPPAVRGPGGLARWRTRTGGHTYGPPVLEDGGSHICAPTIDGSLANSGGRRAPARDVCVMGTVACGRALASGARGVRAVASPPPSLPAREPARRHLPAEPSPRPSLNAHTSSIGDAPHSSGVPAWAAGWTICCPQYGTAEQVSHLACDGERART